MAVLSENDRREVFAKWMRKISNRREACDLLKADLRIAFNDIDTWVDDNSASFNSAISLPARTTLTTKQKAEILADIVLRRWGVI